MNAKVLMLLTICLALCTLGLTTPKEPNYGSAEQRQLYEAREKLVEDYQQYLELYVKNVIEKEFQEIKRLGHVDGQTLARLEKIIHPFLTMSDQLHGFGAEPRTKLDPATSRIWQLASSYSSFNDGLPMARRLELESLLVQKVGQKNLDINLKTTYVKEVGAGICYFLSLAFIPLGIHWYRREKRNAYLKRSALISLLVGVSLSLACIAFTTAIFL